MRAHTGVITRCLHNALRVSVYVLHTRCMSFEFADRGGKKVINMTGIQCFVCQCVCFAFQVYVVFVFTFKKKFFLMTMEQRVTDITGIQRYNVSRVSVYVFFPC